MSGHARERAAWFTAALLASLLAALPAGSLAPVLAWPALLIAFGIAPGAWLAPRLAPGEASDARAAFALLASTLVTGALFTLLRLAGVPGGIAARALATLVALAAASDALRPRHGERTTRSVPAVWAVAVLAAVAVSVAWWRLPALAERSDGAFHAGVVWAAERALPPGDPFFAGLPLHYPWGPHAGAAVWVSLAPALGAYAPLAASSALALASLLLAAGALARRLGASPRTALLAQALALAGAAPFAWLVLLLRAGRGELRGTESLMPALEHGADAALRALDVRLLHPSLLVPLDKFVVLTPFAWALAGTLVLALALARVFEARARRAAAESAVVLAAVCFAHPLAGVSLAGAAALGVVAAFKDRGAPRAHLGRTLLGFALVLLAAAPYVRAAAGATPGGHAVLGLAHDARGVWSALFGGALLLPWAFATLLREREGFGRALAVMLGALVLPACVLSLGGDNQSKFLNLAFALAAPAAACAWSASAPRPWARARVLALLLAAEGPTLAALFWAYAHQGPASLDAPSRPPRAIVSALVRLAPRDAVVLDALQDTTRGAAPALPGDAGRMLYSSGTFLARKWGHPAARIAEREQVRQALAVADWPAVDIAAGATGEDWWGVVPDTPLHTSGPEWVVETRADGVALLHHRPHRPRP